MSQSKYRQIFLELKKQILGAKFDSSNPFPSEAAVAREKQTTRNTVTAPSSNSAVSGSSRASRVSRHGWLRARCRGRSG